MWLPDQQSALGATRWEKRFHLSPCLRMTNTLPVYSGPRLKTQGLHWLLTPLPILGAWGRGWPWEELQGHHLFLLLLPTPPTPNSPEGLGAAQLPLPSCGSQPTADTSAIQRKH